ncbi:MAG TPA: hypothetical protein VG406_20935 [Isosphaeraceae bacterium]|jgi:hypothetical protein|nr:hypothetical protein [Isosphaeraceae bacterium]
MRISHLLFLVGVVAIGLAVGRERVGQVFLVFFLTGVGEVILGTTAIMNLFKSVGAIGRAETPSAYIEAIAATALILAVATATMCGLLVLGGTVLRSLAV